jgi:predicted ATPase
MITRVEISGFKTFTDFSVDLAPLSVIAGANASGKSNFLDALRVIQAVATGKTLATALAGRGRAADYFTKYDQGKSSKGLLKNKLFAA